MVMDLITGVFYVAILYILVRPQSQAGSFLTAFGDLMTAVIKNATDLATATES